MSLSANGMVTHDDMPVCFAPTYVLGAQIIYQIECLFTISKGTKCRLDPHPMPTFLAGNITREQPVDDDDHRPIHLS